MPRTMAEIEKVKAGFVIELGARFSLFNLAAIKASKFNMHMRLRAPKFIQFALALTAFFFVFTAAAQKASPKPAIYDTAAYLPLLKGKTIGVIANQTSVKGDVHLVDYLLANDISIKRVFAPEHGFRGKADAGEKVEDGKDAKTGLPIISLYGKNKKPSQEMLDSLDVLVFDIQDVGVRFYTYISTLTYVMEAAAEKEIPVIVLDRPNPNGHYVDGPILKPEFKSFVGMHPVPVVYGLTIGEYGFMVNEEGWLADGFKCDYTVIKCLGYDHNARYKLPIKPSPNLPNERSIELYPSLCFFEGTVVSAGRGTDYPFQMFGAPFYRTKVSFVPKPNEGSKHPKFEGQKCWGFKLADENAKRPMSMDLSYLDWAYKNAKDKSTFFNNFFNKLSGNAKLQEAIKAGVDVEEIYESWKSDLNTFKETRKKYLLYPDFK